MPRRMRDRNVTATENLIQNFFCLFGCLTFFLYFISAGKIVQVGGKHLR